MNSAAVAPVVGRDFWRRYRAPLVAAIPAGVLLGATADLAFSANTVHASPQDRIPALLAYAGLGEVFALIACIGAGAALLVRRPPAATSASQLWRIAAGSGTAVVIGVLLTGALLAGITETWGWYSFYAMVAVVTGIVAAAGASGITALFQYRHPHLP